MISYGFCLQPGKHNSRRFSEVFRELTGDGVCVWGRQFGASPAGMSLDIDTGFALIGGRWLKNDSLTRLTFPLASNNVDRTGAVAVTADWEARQVRLELLTHIDPKEIDEHSIIHRKNSVSLILYTVFMRRGTTTIAEGDLTDRRKCLIPLSQAAKDILRAYDFLSSGIDQEVARLLGLGQDILDRGDRELQRLDQVIAAAGFAPLLGDLEFSRRHPEPENQWLLCNGVPIPPSYPDLEELVGTRLPNIPMTEKISSYIFAGPPVQAQPGNGNNQPIKKEEV